MYDVCIIGSGFSGSVLAERLASQSHKKVLVLESRPHIGGNAYDYINNHGIRISKYGAHLFHTNRKDVWDYVHQFGHWTPWEHRVLARLTDTLHVPIPICLGSMKALNLAQTVPEMMNWVMERTAQYRHSPILNSRDVALSRVGSLLYEKFFRHYTVKQWAKDPSELEPCVLERIPVRFHEDDRYFTDTYQAQPTNGFTELFENMLDHENITVKTSCDYFEEKHTLQNIPITVFTGAIDRYYAWKGLDKLEYRSIRFEDYDVELDDPTQFVLPASVVNEPLPQIPYTRTVEHKRFLNQVGYVSTLTREYTTDQGEPYYPVPSQRNRDLYEKYRELANQETEKERRKVIFLGRLAGYKYMNMDQAIGNALDEYHLLSV